MIKLQVPNELSGERLDKALARLATEAGHKLSRRKSKALIDQGAVYVDGSRIRIASRQVYPGFVIETNLELVQKKRKPRYNFQPNHILHEDDYIIAVNKPPALPSQPTRDNARDNVQAALERYLTQRDGNPPYLALHHRLDLNTTGVIVLARHKDANKGMTEIFRKRLAQKTYLALTVPRPGDPERKPGESQNEKESADEWVVSNHLQVQKTGRRSKQTVVHSGGDFAETRFHSLAQSDGAWLVEAQPQTGRMHQIRVHLSHQNMPILGDPFYGGPRSVSRVNIPRMMLHAVRLEFAHPVSGKPVTIKAPLPSDFRETSLQLLETLPDELCP